MYNIIETQRRLLCFVEIYLLRKSNVFKCGANKQCKAN